MKRGSLEGNLLSPSLTQCQDSPNTQIPLSDIDYESDPADVAQALSNLQALRRMSMDVGSTNDPDLPSFQGSSFISSIAPTGSDNDDDPSRIFWVPARVHPELAPSEFKTFLENRLQSIKRQNREQPLASLDGTEHNGTPSPGSSLKRKKSMLSHQVNTNGDLDPSNQLSNRLGRMTPPNIPDIKTVDIEKIDALVRNPSEAMRKMTLESTGNSLGGLEDENEVKDIPILPQVPGNSLRRSTRTTYRRGSLRKGERVAYSRRAGSLRKDILEDYQTDISTEGQIKKSLPFQPPERTVSAQESSSVHETGRLNHVQVPPSEVFSAAHKTINEESILTREARSSSLTAANPNIVPDSPSPTPKIPYTTNRTNSSHLEPTQKIRSSPAEEILFSRKNNPTPSEPMSTQQNVGKPAARPQPTIFPGRTSSQSSQQNLARSQPSSSDVNLLSTIPNSNIPPTLPAASCTVPAAINQSQKHSILSTSNVRSDAFPFVPVIDVKKSDKKSKKDKDDSENHNTKKSTWNWFKGNDDKEKKERKKDDEREARKNKKYLMEKTHDTTSLDLLQTTLDNGLNSGRENNMLDRDHSESRSIDEKKKESRKFSGTGGEKREKDSLFSSIFGGGKKKNDRDSSGKKGSSLRTLSPELVTRNLKPDVDYNWTRFSILEERAIYRMAHIKLANPRRALHSQVLLSNFMYSYLAKVQQMHPHLQIPQSALQKKQEMERRLKEQEQQAMQQVQEVDQHQYEYHEVSV